MSPTDSCIKLAEEIISTPAEEKDCTGVWECPFCISTLSGRFVKDNPMEEMTHDLSCPYVMAKEVLADLFGTEDLSHLKDKVSKFLKSTLLRNFEILSITRSMADPKYIQINFKAPNKLDYSVCVLESELK